MQGMQIPVQMQMQMGMQAPNAVPMPGQMQSMGFFPGMSGEWNQGSLPRSKGRGGGSRARGGGSRGAGRGASHGRGTSEHWSVQAHKRKRPGTQDASVAGKQQKRSQEDINTFVQTLLSGERRGQGTDQQEAPSTSGAAGERSYEPPSRSERTGESWPQDFANRKSLRERHEAVVRSLYDDLPHQCQQTGLRFGESSSYSSHLDALILRRKRQKDTTMSSRSWYVTLEQWILGTSRGHTDEVRYILYVFTFWHAFVPLISSSRSFSCCSLPSRLPCLLCLRGDRLAPSKERPDRRGSFTPRRVKQAYVCANRGSPPDSNRMAVV